MANINSHAHIELAFTFTINEVEARALDALVGYGTESFLKVFYEHMGRAYLEKHEKGIISLFDAVRSQVPSVLSRLEKAKTEFAGKKKSVNIENSF